MIRGEEEAARVKGRLLGVFDLLDGLERVHKRDEQMSHLQQIMELCYVGKTVPGADDILPVLIEAIKATPLGAEKLNRFLSPLSEGSSGLGLEAYLLTTFMVVLGQVAVELDTPALAVV